jgi:hypothetical protein
MFLMLDNLQHCTMLNIQHHHSHFLSLFSAAPARLLCRMSKVQALPAQWVPGVVQPPNTFNASPRKCTDVKDAQR